MRGQATSIHQSSPGHLKAERLQPESLQIPTYVPYIEMHGVSNRKGDNGIQMPWAEFGAWGRRAESINVQIRSISLVLGVFGGPNRKNAGREKVGRCPSTQVSSAKFSAGLWKISRLENGGKWSRTQPVVIPAAHHHNTPSQSLLCRVVFVGSSRIPNTRNTTEAG